MLTDEAVKAIQKDKKVRYYFRYRLHGKDFKEVKRDGKVLGHYAAKPLYGRFMPDGRVDRSAGYNGKVAVLFISSVKDSLPEVIITEIPKDNVLLESGKRNWGAIRKAAEEAVKIYKA